MSPCPGDLYLADFGEPSRRPVIVVSREELNQGDRVLAIPLTTQRLEERLTLRNCVPFRRGRFGLDKDCVAQAEGLTLIDKAELDEEPFERLDDGAFREVVRAIGYVMGACCEPE